MLHLCRPSSSENYLWLQECNEDGCHARRPWRYNPESQTSRVRVGSGDCDVRALNTHHILNNGDDLTEVLDEEDMGYEVVRPLSSCGRVAGRKRLDGMHRAWPFYD
jgi:hypothetical protein